MPQTPGLASISQTNRPFLPAMLQLFLIVIASSVVVSPARAADAVVVEVYQQCRLVDTNVVINEGVVSPRDNAEIKARVAAASPDAELAVPRIVQILKDFGISDVAVSQQGLAGCEPDTSGKFVQAVGTYCGPRLTHAEVLVDRATFLEASDPDGSFEEFLRGAVKRLRTQGVYDRPLVSIENAPDCQESS